MVWISLLPNSIDKFTLTNYSANWVNIEVCLISPVDIFKNRSYIGAPIPIIIFTIPQFVLYANYCDQISSHPTSNKSKLCCIVIPHTQSPLPITHYPLPFLYLRNYSKADTVWTMVNQLLGLWAWIVLITGNFYLIYVLNGKLLLRVLSELSDMLLQH